MDFSFIAFMAFATVAIVGSLMVIFKKNPVASAFSLIMVLFSFAGIYALMGAHFVAALQILVYTGAIMVLFVFVIMLLNVDQPENDLEQTSFLVRAITGLALLSLGSVLIRTLMRTNEIAPTGTFTSEKIKEAGGSVQVISELLFSDYVFQFELLSFLILYSVVATVALAKRKSRSSEGAAP